MSTEATRYAISKGAAWITLNRPENRNALSAVLVDELDAHLRAANEDPAVRAIVITGTDPAFCAGADLKNPPGKAGPGQRGVEFVDVLKFIVASPKPVIVAVNGAAFAGGLGLVGAADIVIAVDDAPMSFSEVRIGVIPAVIAVVCVPKLGIHHPVGIGRQFLHTARGLTHAVDGAHQGLLVFRRQQQVHALAGFLKLVEQIHTMVRQFREQAGANRDAFGFCGARRQRLTRLTRIVQLNKRQASNTLKT